MWLVIACMDAVNNNDVDPFFWCMFAFHGLSSIVSWIFWGFGIHRCITISRNRNETDTAYPMETVQASDDISYV